jgi:predicted metal-dependent phosphoesterase TrpH
MKYADLHVHTFYSDSTFSPEEVVSCAVNKGLSAIAVCDHDSVDGIAPCIELGRRMEVEIIPGIELTVEKADAEIHILGYFMDYGLGWFRDRLRELQKARIERIHRMVKLLRGRGIEVYAEDVFRMAGRGTVGRLHLAQAMLETGKVGSFKEIFEDYIGFGKPCYVSSVRFTPKEAVEMLLRAGGVPVLAHPYVMGKDEYIPELMGYGLRGIEVYHTDHKPAVTRHYEELARDYGLIMTGGSDCHGLGKGRVLLGGVRVPYAVVERLGEEAERIRSAYRAYGR